MGTEIDRLEVQVEAQATKANNQLDKLVEKLDALSSSLSHLNSGGLAGLANGVAKFAQASTQLSNVKTADFTRLTKNIEKLSSLNTQQIYSAASSMKTLSTAINSLSGVSASSMQVAQVAKDISKLGGANVQKAITNLPALATAMNDLMATLSKAPAVSSNVIQMTNALASLASQGGKVGTASRSIESGLNSYGNAAAKATKKTMSLAAAIGKFYASWFLIVRGVKKLWTSIESSMDYVETLNYFDAAFGQVAEKAVAQWEDAGYNSADAYYESFSDRAKELTSKMTGFSVNDDGTLTATGNASLGINPSQLMNYQAMFAQMSSSMGVASETSLKLSQALTEIGGDLASVKNMDFDKVWQDMASGLAGMSRTLDKYGVNIRNVNLQQKLTELGIEANITALNQNDKALLRAIILLDSTRYAWGDLADTLNQPANQLRLLESNFSNLSRTIGNLFLPAVSTVLPYVNGLVIALQRLFSWVGSLMGIDLSKITSAVGSSEFDFSNLLEDTDDLTGSLGDAADAADKLKKGIRSFDELNVITTSDSSDSGADITAGLTNGLLDAAFDKAFSEYQAAWDEAFANMENRANEFADKVEGYLQPVKDIIEDFAIGDFFKAGQDTSNLVAGIFNFFADAIDDVDWYAIGENIGDYLAGVNWTEILDSFGNLLWQGIKGAIELWKGSFDAAPIETTIVTALLGMKIAKIAIPAPIKIGLTVIAFAPNIAKAIGEALGIDETIFGDSIEELSWSYVFEKLEEGFTNESGELSLTKGIKFTLEVLEANVIGTAELLGLSDSDNPLVRFLFSPTEDILKALPVGKWLDENIVQPIISGSGNLKDGISNIWDNISSWWSGTVLAEIKNIPEKISNLISELPGEIGYWLGNALGEFLIWTVKVTNYLSQKVPEIISKIGIWFREMPFKIGEHLSSAIAKMEEWAKDSVSFVMQKVPEITGNIIDFFEELPSKIFEIGKNIMSGLWNGLQDGWSWIKDGITDFGNGVVEGFKNALDIHSPSRVMFALGEFTMEGFQLGIESLYSSVNQSLGVFGSELQFDIAPSPQPAYGGYYSSPTFPTVDYSSYSYYENQNNYDSAETNMLLREQNELLHAILQKPNIGKDDVFNAARAVYKDKATRRYGNSCAFDPVWG